MPKIDEIQFFILFRLTYNFWRSGSSSRKDFLPRKFRRPKRRPPTRQLCRTSASWINQAWKEIISHFTVCLFERCISFQITWLWRFPVPWEPRCHPYLSPRWRKARKGRWGNNQNPKWQALETSRPRIWGGYLTSNLGERSRYEPCELSLSEKSDSDCHEIGIKTNLLSAYLYLTKTLNLPSSNCVRRMSESFHFRSPLLCFSLIWCLRLQSYFFITRKRLIFRPRPSDVTKGLFYHVNPC